jgi:putative redox protein
MSDTHTDSAAADIQVEERIHPIHVNSEYIKGYQVASTIRDLDTLYCDEPTELGGKNSGATPLETTLAALNSCSSMIAYVLRREMRFDLQALRIETEGWVEVRRVEMKRTGKKYSEIEPLAEHYQKVVQRFYLTTDEPDERIEALSRDVERLCPLQVLFRDAGVDMQIEWIRA